MIPTRRRTPPSLLPLSVLILVLSACSTATQASAPAPHGSTAVQPTAPIIAVSPTDGDSTVRLDTEVRVTSIDGELDTVVLHQLDDPTPLPGQMARDRSGWESTAFFDPSTTYVVEATAHGLHGLATSTKSAFRTEATAGRLITSPQPADGSTVGVGMPVILHFNTPIPPQAQEALVQRVTVQSTPTQVGAWHWFSPTEVHWRPQNYWRPGTRVTVTGNLRGLDAGNDYWGLGDFTFGFTIGDKHVSIIDTGSHQMTVFDNDQLIHTYPISAGRPRNPTLNGILFVRYRQYDVLMDSETIGIPRYSPDGYYEHVYWDTAISSDGFFVHSAPWSVWAQGTSNVSHGCVNLSPARAQEFYNFSQIGDIVQVTNSPRPAGAGDGEGDWQIPFDQFANSGGPNVSTPTTNGPGGGL